MYNNQLSSLMLDYGDIHLNRPKDGFELFLTTDDSRFFYTIKQQSDLESLVTLYCKEKDTPSIRVKTSNEQAQMIKEFYKKYQDYKNGDSASDEATLLKELDVIQTKLFTDQQTKMLLTNFIEIYYQDIFKNPELFYIHEDDLLAQIFNREKKLEGFFIGQVSYFQKLIDLFRKRGIIDDRILNKYGLLIVIRTLREIAIEYYSSEFNKVYGGYFSSIDEKAKLIDWIEAFSQIDFIDKTEEQNIGFFTYYLYSKFIEDCTNFSLLDTYRIVKENVCEFNKNDELNLFENQLMNSKNHSTNKNGFNGIKIEDVDLMSGIEFEAFIQDLFKRMGYSVNLTRASGDQGIDLIAKKNGLSIGIQTKCYSNSVSNKAVQEVAAGIKYYNLSKAMVITNNYFTKSAIELAISNDVTLWDRSLLKEKIKEVY